MELSIVVPAYNEEDNIAPFYSALCKTFADFNKDYEVIFIDDGSSDSTLTVMKSLVKKISEGGGLQSIKPFG